MNRTFDSSGNKLAYHLAHPIGRDDVPGLILCHGFPIGPLDARRSAGTFPELVDRIAHDVGYIGMTFTFRGCGTITGDFSLQGWTAWRIHANPRRFELPQLVPAASEVSTGLTQSRELALNENRGARCAPLFRVRYRADNGTSGAFRAHEVPR